VKENAMVTPQTLGEILESRGVSRRAFLKYSSYMSALMALPPSMATAMAQGLAAAKRQSVIWLSFQECTGCTESLTRSYSPSLEDLIFDFISLDYHHTLQAASGEAAEARAAPGHARQQGRVHRGRRRLGAAGGGGIYSAIAGQTNVEMLAETVPTRKAVVSVGTCAAYGGLPEGEAQSDRRGGHLEPGQGQAADQHPRLPADAAGHGRHADAHLCPSAACPSWTHLTGRWPSSARPSTTAATAGRSTSAASSPRLRRRGRAQGLVPVRAGLQGPGDLQRLRVAEVERRRVLPDPVGPWLHRLLGAGFLGPRRLYKPLPPPCRAWAWRSPARPPWARRSASARR
jgi:hypothetical protein